MSTPRSGTAGFFRILLPRRFGGYELDLETAVKAILELSATRGSAGWATSCAIFHHAFFNWDVMAEMNGQAHLGLEVRGAPY